jgi:hypothetical protein
VKDSSLFKHLSVAFDKKFGGNFSLGKNPFKNANLTAKFLVAENDEGLHKFVQEYA